MLRYIKYMHFNLQIKTIVHEKLINNMRYLFRYFQNF